MNCKNCNQELESNAAYCNSCGTSVEQPENNVSNDLGYEANNNIVVENTQQSYSQTDTPISQSGEVYTGQSEFPPQNYQQEYTQPQQVNYAPQNPPQAYPQSPQQGYAPQIPPTGIPPATTTGLCAATVLSTTLYAL